MWSGSPSFSPPNGLLNVYVTEAPRLLICIGYTLRRRSLGFFCGVTVGYALGVALGWSKRFSYWGMPILKLIGPVPATAWISCYILFLSDHVRFLIGLFRSGLGNVTGTRFPDFPRFPRV